MKNKLLIIVGIFIFASMTIFTLYFLSDKTNHLHSGFERHFMSHILLESKKLDIKYNSYYIAGVTRNRIYLGNTTASSHLLITNMFLTETEQVKIQNIGKSIKPGAVQITIDSPNFYIVDLATYTTLQGTLKDFETNNHTKSNLFFIDAVPIGNNSYVLRTFDSRTKECTLAKKTSNSLFLKYGTGLLEKQVDGLFCTDGMLHYNQDLAWLVYVYYYRNQFICLDTSLNLIYRGNTIDTISQAKIKVTAIKSDNTVTLSSPPFLVNKKSSVAGNYLFNHSNLMAKNEKIHTFKNASVIDVYSLKDGTYLFSFYLPDYNGSKVKTFKVFGNKLLAIFDHYLISYSLNSDYL